MRAWLITWEWTGEHARVNAPQNIAAILNSRLSTDSVLEFAKVILARERYSLEEQAGIAQRTRFWRKHFELIYSPGSQEGVPLGDRFTLGQNPHLLARRVNNFRFENGVAMWDEIRLTPEQIAAFRRVNS